MMPLEDSSITKKINQSGAAFFRRHVFTKSVQIKMKARARVITEQLCWLQECRMPMTWDSLDKGGTRRLERKILR